MRPCLQSRVHISICPFLHILPPSSCLKVPEFRGVKINPKKCRLRGTPDIHVCGLPIKMESRTNSKRRRRFAADESINSSFAANGDGNGSFAANEK
jgi:hypothetical protein